METYLNCFMRAAREGKDFQGMPAWLVKILAETILEEYAAIRAECTDQGVAAFETGI